MGLKTFKPTTPSKRFQQSLDYGELSRNRPEKSLTKGISKNAGRGSSGQISVRRRGGGHKRKYRAIDFKRNKYDIPGRVAQIEYDPNRSANIALINYADGEKRYILCPQGLELGMTVLSGNDIPIEVGNSMPLELIPLGRNIHNIELKPKAGGQLVRSAGNSATVLAKADNYVSIRLPSGEVRRVLKSCSATLGAVGNEDLMNVSYGKAGRSRWLGKRPKVRGVVMNPVDHPHGGGEGKTSGGRHPVSPWGQGAKGLKTRKKNKPSNVFIVTRRKKK